MRVTDKAVFDAASRSAVVLRDRMQRAVNENATGLKVEHPWDDPGVTAPLVAHRLTATRQDALATTAERSNDELLATDNALSSITEVLARARELAIQLANDSYSVTDRVVGSQEISNLFANTIGLLNTRVGNRYLFAGFQDDEPAFDANGVYTGDAGVRQVEAFPGVMQDVSMPGDEIARGSTGGPDILGTLQDLQQALATNDLARVRGSLDVLDKGIEHMSLTRAKLGAASNTLYVAIDTARNNVVNEKATISRLSETDVFESATKLALAQRALEAALTASARGFDLTLLHKLG